MKNLRTILKNFQVHFFALNIACMWRHTHCRFRHSSAKIFSRVFSLNFHTIIAKALHRINIEQAAILMTG